MSPSSALKMIKDARGITILGHPKSKTPEFSYSHKHLLELLKLKFDGIEVYASTHTKKEVEQLKKLAKQKNLLISAGSDYHGYDKEIPIGICNTGKYVKIDKCKELLAKLDVK